MQSTPYVPPMQPAQPNELHEPGPPVQVVESSLPAQPPQTRRYYRVDTEPRPSVSAAYRATQTVYLLFGIVEALIIARVALKLLAANSGVGFVRFIYDVSHPLVAPFQGIFPTPVSNTNVLELSSLVALAVYAVVAWAIIRLIALLRRRSLSTTAE